MHDETNSTCAYLKSNEQYKHSHNSDVYMLFFFFQLIPLTFKKQKGQSTLIGYFKHYSIK